MNDDELFKHPTDGIKYGSSIELMLYEADEDYNKSNFLNGKVMGEFICDNIEDIFPIEPLPWGGSKDYSMMNYSMDDTCVSFEELDSYLDGSLGYGWHISDLVIYNKPKELNEFTPSCKFLNDDGSCQCEKVSCSWQETDFNPDNSVNLVSCEKRITRPPQSWCYVEALS